MQSMKNNVKYTNDVRKKILHERIFIINSSVCKSRVIHGQYDILFKMKC